ncbi:SOS response-associated peptidase [Streptomyces cinerochromogenes]|uniref:Abasic site processing protein n=1 Tax=Streptomyces cinerochromogenes TaxID=66422 RepID=A0ABW7B9G3_9ACTN
MCGTSPVSPTPDRPLPWPAALPVLLPRLRGLRADRMPRNPRMMILCTVPTLTRMINARVETVHEKPAFRRAFVKRRCLLPADGFYEWQAGKDPATGRVRKQPYFVHPEDDQVMALAGLYEYWRDATVIQDDDSAPWLMTCTIITTEATDAAGHVHPRMPLALTEDHYEAWLAPHQAPDELRALLGLPAGGHLDARPVSTAVNNVRNNGPQLLKAISP